eukprot:jgi/Astpho2/7102/Aster-08466
MQHYQVPSVQYSSYINHVINLGLAGDYIAQLHGRKVAPQTAPVLSERPLIKPADTCLAWWMISSQCRLETLGQQNGAPIPDAAVGFAATMPNTPEEEARILRCTQHINVRQGAAKPHNTVQAEKSAAKLWKVDTRYCEQEASPDGDLMSQAKILEFSIWLVDEAGNQPMSGQTLNVHLRQAFDLAGVPCGRLDGYSTKGEVSHKFKKHGVEAAKNVGINKAEIKMAARHESDTTDLYCIFDPDTAHRLAVWGQDWKENHRLGQADFKVRLRRMCWIASSLGLTVLLRQAGVRCHPAHPLLAPLRVIDHLRQVFVQNASLRIQSYGDQWLRTIPPAASRLLQSAVCKQLRQETWDKHIAAERILNDKNEFFTNPMAFFKTLSGKEATPMPVAP